MRRRLFGLFAGLALLLCVAIALLWARSHRIQDDYDAGATSYTSRWGSLIVVHFHSFSPGSDLSGVGYTAVPVGETNRAWAELDQLKTKDISALGAGLAWLESGPLKGWRFTVPHWMVVVLAALAPVLWMAGRLRSTNPDTAGSDAGQLRWQSQWGWQTATHGACYYIRESGGSMIAGGVFATVFAVGGLAYGGHLLLTGTDWSARVFACLCLLVGALFACVLWSCVRNGRWMIVYDRGGPSAPAEIRLRKKRLPAERIRSISTRHSGGSASMPQRIVVAELHDGTFETLGPSGVSTWPDHWGQQAATWMGLPFRRATK